VLLKGKASLAKHGGVIPRCAIRVTEQQLRDPQVFGASIDQLWHAMISASEDLFLFIYSVPDGRTVLPFSARLGLQAV
jgi:hypothetical protein